jgi:TetR/AcrR family transcriptional regulator of autoinduction and epiphytic fitness
VQFTFDPTGVRFGLVPPTRGPSDQKREAILKAALKTFRSSGFHATSMDEIALQANVSKRTVYNHFPSKDVLFDTITAELWSQLIPNDELPPPGSSVEARLAGIAHQRVGVLLRSDLVGLLRAVLGESQQTPELARAYVGGRDDRTSALGLRALLVDEVARGRLDVEQLDLAAGQFWGLVLNPLFWPLVLGLRSLPDAEERALVIDEAVTTFMARFGARRRKTNHRKK